MSFPGIGYWLRDEYAGQQSVDRGPGWPVGYRIDEGTHTVIVLDTLVADPQSPRPGPADTAVQRDEIRRELANIQDDRTRIALVLTYPLVVRRVLPGPHRQQGLAEDVATLDCGMGRTGLLEREGLPDHRGESAGCRLRKCLVGVALQVAV